MQITDGKHVAYVHPRVGNGGQSLYLDIEGDSHRDYPVVLEFDDQGRLVVHVWEKGATQDEATATFELQDYPVSRREVGDRLPV
jgi:hypothetical protein